jgi:hypothetical protein
LVDHPIERAAVAQAILEHFGRNFGERELGATYLLAIFKL